MHYWNLDYNAPNDIIVEDGSGKLIARCFNAAGYGWTADALVKILRSIPYLLEEAYARGWEAGKDEGIAGEDI